MKVFIAFILICVVVATLLRKRDLKTSVYMLCTLALLVSLGYFFFNQI
jgi:UDP-N-acetylmuramyl pentapeptide phosphotransferase/UDP-N-acetylglucosamine-1-phosphate transferase